MQKSPGVCNVRPPLERIDDLVLRLGAGLKRTGAWSHNAPVRILIVNLHYAPDLAPTGQLMTELAEDLAQRGAGLTVLTGFPGYTPEATRLKVPREEMRNGVRVLRVRSLRLGRKSMIARVLNYLTFYAAVTLRALMLPRQDVALVLSSPPFIAYVGLALKWLRGTRMIYNVQDLIPDAIVTTGLLKNRLLIRMAESFSKLLLKRADCVVAIGEAMRERIIAKGVPAARVEVVHNWADAHEITPGAPPSDRFRQSLRPGILVLYSGNMGTNHDVETILDALGRMNRFSPATFLFVGSGVRMDKLKSCAERERWDHVRFQPYVPREELPGLLAAGDVHLVCLRRGLGGKVVPSKVYTSMAAGRPVLALGPSDSELASIVRESDCGVTVENGRADEFQEAVTRLADNPGERKRMGENGRRAFMEKYQRRIATGRYADFLLGGGGVP